MLFKSLGGLTALGNASIIAGLIYNDTIFDYGSFRWSIGIGSLLFLSALSTTFFWLDNQKNGINALKVYGGIYTFAALLIYSYWGVKNLFYSTKGDEYLALGLISFIFLCIGIISNSQQAKHKFFLLKAFASVLSVITVILSFGVIYKYIIAMNDLNFDTLLLELFIIIIGAGVFIATYHYAEKNS